MLDDETKRKALIGCSVQLVLWAVFGVAFYVYTRGRFDPPADWIVAVSVGFFTSFGVVNLIGWLRVPQSAIVDRSLRGSGPIDGESYAAIGRLYATGEPLRAPFSRSPCLAFSWKVDVRLQGPTLAEERILEQQLRQSGGKYVRSNPGSDQLAMGYGFAPCVVRSSDGTECRLSSVRAAGILPDLDALSPSELDPDDARQIARRLLSSDRLEDSGVSGLTQALDGESLLDGPVVRAFDTGGHRGQYVREASGSERVVETVLPEGVEIVVVGRWSAADQTLEPDIAGYHFGSASSVLKEQAANRRQVLLMGLFFTSVPIPAAYYGLPHLIAKLLPFIDVWWPTPMP